MAEKNPVALVLRGVNEGNVLVQSRGISFQNVSLATDEFALMMAGISDSRGAENPLGPHYGVPSFVSGTIFVSDGLYRVQYRLVNQVYILCISVPYVSSTLCGTMLQSAVQSIAVHAKALEKLGIETVVKFYPEIYLSFRSIVRSHGESADPAPELLALFSDPAAAEPSGLKRVMSKAPSARGLKVGRSLSGLGTERMGSGVPAAEGPDGMDMIPEDVGDYSAREPVGTRGGFHDADDEDGASEGPAGPSDVEFTIPEGAFPSAAALAPDARDLSSAAAADTADTAADPQGGGGSPLLPPGRAASGVSGTSYAASALRGMINSPTGSPPLSPRSSVVSGPGPRAAGKAALTDPRPPHRSDDPFAIASAGMDADPVGPDTEALIGGLIVGGGGGPVLPPPAAARTSATTAGPEDFDWGFLDDGETARRAARSPEAASPAHGLQPPGGEDEFFEDLFASPEAAPTPGPAPTASPFALAPPPPAPASAILRNASRTPEPSPPPPEPRPQPSPQPHVAAPTTAAAASPADFNYDDIFGTTPPAKGPSASPSPPPAPLSPSPPPMPPPQSAPSPVATSAGLALTEQWTAEFYGRTMARVSTCVDVAVTGPPTLLPPLLSLALHGLPHVTVKTVAGAQGATTAGPSPYSFYVYANKLPSPAKGLLLRATLDAPSSYDLRPAKAVLTVTPLLPAGPAAPSQILVALQLGANPALSGLKNVDILLPPLPAFLGPAPAKATPRAHWDSKRRVLKWSILMIRGGTEACARALFQLAQPELMNDALAYFAAQFHVEATFSCSVGANAAAPTLSGVSVRSLGAPVEVQGASMGRIVARPAFLLPPGAKEKLEIGR